MAATPSTMLPLGTPAPDFALPDPHGVTHRLADAGDSRAVVVMFLCNHCPFVKHIARELGLVTQRFAAQGAAVFGINSNDIEAYPDDGPEQMATMARAHGWDFPYLLDEDQSVAKAYAAACTPDFFVFDQNRNLAYRGQFDSSRPSNDVPVTGEDLARAAKAILAGETVAGEQVASMGCNIKWRPGNEPEYF